MALISTRDVRAQTQSLRQTARSLDTNKDGVIKLADLKRADPGQAKTLQAAYDYLAKSGPVTAKKLDSLLNEAGANAIRADRNRDGFISQTEARALGPVSRQLVGDTFEAAAATTVAGTTGGPAAARVPYEAQTNKGAFPDVGKPPKFFQTVNADGSRRSVGPTKAGLEVDTDGVSKAGDQTHQGNTSFRMKGGKSLDSAKTPYVALPPEWARKAGLKLGDLVKVTVNGKSQFAVYGDNSADGGPKDPIRKYHKDRPFGEGSVALHKALRGSSFKNINNGLASGVDLEAFPGSGAKLGLVAGKTTQAPTAAELNAMGANL